MTALWLFALLHLYLGWRVAPALPGPLAAGLFTGWLIVSAALIPMAMFGRRNRRREQADRWSGAGMAALGLFSSLLVLSLLRDLSLLLAAALGLLARWPGWPMATAVALPVLAGLISLWGGFNARRTAAVKLVDVPVPGLPAGLQGFRIAQISDVHVGPTIKAPYLQAIVDRVNRLQADVVAITGDLVDGRVADLAPTWRRWPACGPGTASSSSPATTSITAAPWNGWPNCAGWACRCCSTSTACWTTTAHPCCWQG